MKARTLDMDKTMRTSNAPGLRAAMIGPITLTFLLSGCHKPTDWSYTGARVYLIEGTPEEQSDGLFQVLHELEKQEINAAIYSPEDWLRIVVDIDDRPQEDAILVGHGHGAFLATQVVRHYAQQHKSKLIKAVFTIDPYNKDWPHNARECGLKEPHVQPMPTPVGQNAVKIRNFVQTDPASRHWGGDLVTTRGSSLARSHPYYWYDNYWNRDPVVGQHLREQLADGITHETIDNNRRLLQRIIMLCRKAALSPYHYTPPEHHPDVKAKASPHRSPRKKDQAT